MKMVDCAAALESSRLSKRQQKAKRLMVERAYHESRLAGRRGTILHVSA
jgi:hypothetical protein